MTEGRALLTEREREALADDESGSYRYKTRSYLRNRLDRLERDAELLAEREPELFERLQSAVQNASTEGESAPTAPADTSPTPAARDAGASTQPATDGVSVSAVVDTVAEATLPGSGEKLEARREALHAAVEYLREHGTATPSDFQADVYPDHTGRYTEGDDPPYSWWTNCVYEGLHELAERTDLIGNADTTGKWTWQGEA
jgi:hypothetical protein